MIYFKKALRYLDKWFFRSYFVGLRGHSLLLKQREEFDAGFQRSIRINYDYRQNDLAALCDKYGTDKGSNMNTIKRQCQPHVSDFYMKFFAKFDSSTDIFELVSGLIILT